MVVLRKVGESQLKRENQLDLFSWKPKARASRSNLPILSYGNTGVFPKYPGKPDSLYSGGTSVNIGSRQYLVRCGVSSDFIKNNKDLFSFNEGAWNQINWPIKQTPEEIARMLDSALKEIYFRIVGNADVICISVFQNVDNIRVQLNVFSKETRKWMDLQNYAGKWLVQDIKTSSVRSEDGVTISVNSISVKLD